MTRKTPVWRRYLRFWGADVAADVDEELRFHVEMRVEEYVARGMTEEEARRAVMERLGDVDAARAECIALGKVREKSERQADFLDGLRADVRFALRSLARTPGWTAVALLTIALGVGATTTVLSVADRLVVRPIPYPDASRVFVLRRMAVIGERDARWPLPAAAVDELRDNARSIEATAPFGRATGQLGAGPDTITVHAAVIDTGFLAFAGAHPIAGRNFTAEESLPDGPGVMLLAEDFWRRQYGGSHDVIGKVVRLNSRPRTIIGVLPASLALPDLNIQRPDIWIPFRPNQGSLGVAVRLSRDVSAKVATDELTGILERSHVDDFPPPNGAPWRLQLSRPGDDLHFRQALLMLTGAVVLLLLVACTNVAHLLLARGAARQRELAVRHALGAARPRLLRQLITESVVLAMMGGALAALMGWAGLRLLAAARPANLVPLSYVSMHRGVISLASALAVAAGLAVGLVSALRSAHRDLGTSLRMGASTTPLAGRRLRAVLVVGEVALSATLLVGALLLIHTVFDLQRTPLGFDPRGIYGVRFDARGPVTTENRSAFAALLRERSAGMPGVGSVTTAALVLPLATAVSKLETPEHPSNGGPPGSTHLSYVERDYFSTMGIPLLAGRTFDDGSAARNEVIVSRSLADELWPDGIAVGRRFRNTFSGPILPPTPWLTVIGVVPDVVANLLQDAAEPTLYRPAGGEDGFPQVTVIVRLHGEDAGAQLKELATLAGPSWSKPSIENVRETLDESMAGPRFTMRVLVVFAALGVLLAAIGLFGVISYNVGQRTREIGVRMTLGATRGSIARLVVGDGVRLALLGIAVGLLGAVAATRLIQNLLYGVPRLDPFAFGLGATLLLVVSAAACVVPMLRATGVDPAIAVRSE